MTKIVFQGDSITDCGRGDYSDPTALGRGYPHKVHGYLELFHAGEYTVLNRGISGNRTCDVLGRWEPDCLALAPDVLSILIGINDCWRRYDRNLPMSAQTFEEHYTELLDQVRARLPQTRVILLEPFLIPADPDKERWHEDLDEKQRVVRKLARAFDTEFIPLDGIFAKACTENDPSFWAADGVHPTDAGHALIAQEFLAQMAL